MIRFKDPLTSAVVVGALGGLALGASADDLKARLAAVPEKLTGTIDEDTSFVRAMLDEAINARRTDLNDELMAIARRADELSRQRYEAGLTQSGAVDVCVMTLDCLWRTTRPAAYFNACVESRLEMPVLAGVSMLMLARTPNRANVRVFWASADEIAERYPKSNVGSLGFLARQAVVELSNTCSAADSVLGLSEQDRIKRLIEVASNTNDWITPTVVEELEGQEVFGDWRADSARREMLPAAVHWARNALLELSTVAPASVVDALAHYPFKMDSPPKPPRNEGTDITDIYKRSILAILVRDCLSATAQELWKLKQA